MCVIELDANNVAVILRKLGILGVFVCYIGLKISVVMRKEWRTT